MPAVSLAEVLATSDVPGGVVNILTGSVTELVPWLAGHMDVNAIDVTGVPADLMAQVEELAAENVKRVHRGAGRRPVQRRRPEPVRDHRAHGVQDRLAPDGRLTEDNDRAAGARGPDGLTVSFVPRSAGGPGVPSPPGIAVEAPVGSPATTPRPFIALNISARPMSPDDDSPSVSSVTGRTTGADTVGAVERPIIVPTNSAAATEAAATTPSTVAVGDPRALHLQ